jgi:hypothetical protein
VALDRPAHRPDHPEPEPAPEIPTQTRADAWASHRYWNETAHFAETKNRLADQWPGVQHKELSPPREHDVSPELRHEAADRVRAIADGEPPISDAVQAATAQSSHGGQLAGFDHRRKGEDRLMEKALDGLEAQPDATAEEVVGRIPDAIRYTICFETSEYVGGYLDVKSRLEASGCTLFYSKNSWTDAEYKGINTRWMAPEGQRFEVQFHTQESFHAKHEVTHLAYERLRGSQATRAERAALRAFQREVSSWIPLPQGVTKIPDYRKEGF